MIDGADAGWPRCHAGDLVDPEFGGEDACDGVAEPAVTFGAHTAPLALLAWDGHLVVALHGSWNRSGKAGYALWWLPWDGGRPERLSRSRQASCPKGPRMRSAAPPDWPSGRTERSTCRTTRAATSTGSRVGSLGRRPRGRTIRRSGSRSPPHVERAVDEQSVADLVEPLVTSPPEGPPEYVATAGRTLARQGSVTVTVSESQRVVAVSPTAKRPSRSNWHRPPKASWRAAIARSATPGHSARTASRPRSLSGTAAEARGLGAGVELDPGDDR